VFCSGAKKMAAYVEVTKRNSSSVCLVPFLLHPPPTNFINPRNQDWAKAQNTITISNEDP